MIRKHAVLLALSAASLALTGCQSVVLAPVGNYSVVKSTVVLGRPWNDISALVPSLPKTAKLLSQDGPLLNRVYVLGGLPAGGFLVRASSKETPTPIFRAGMTARERVEFVTDSVAAMGYQRPESSQIARAKLGATDAVRFNLTCKTSDGLDVSGTAYVAEKDGKLYLLLYLAPTEHYFAATLPDVEQMAEQMTVG